ncbi:Glycylpeptide N-tetradecanoyltransferase 2 [Xenotaenia resolanae]|uniref:Glycylpeptide N-tetradecanoyltransferase 2 n=1 Tax=Xenotaenia resolanae TaxID=208358 RepID=A0ABV0VU64_9TELE
MPNVKRLFHLSYPLGGAVSPNIFFVFIFFHLSPAVSERLKTFAGSFLSILMMAEDSESAASQQSLELDDQDTCGIDGDNEEENEHMQGSPGGELGAKRKKKKQKRKKEKPNSGSGAKSDSASDSQEIKNPGLPIQKLQDIQRAMELLSCQGPAKSIDDATKHKYQFWDTQPVPKLSKFQTKLKSMVAVLQ